MTSSSDNSMNISENEKEYVDTVCNLSNMLSNVIDPAVAPIKTLIHTLKDIEIDDPKMVKLGGAMPEVLANSLAEAKAADDIYGPNSLKASDAWNYAEQVAMDLNISGSQSPLKDGVSPPVLEKEENLRYKEAAMISHHDFSAVIDPQSLDDAIEALMKLEHLTRLVAVERNRLSYHFDVVNP